MTFVDWEKTAEQKKVLHYGYMQRHERAVLDMQGQCVFMETMFHWMEDPVVFIKAVDFNIKSRSDVMKLACKHGAKWEEGYYAEEGYGWPVWKGEDGARGCWDFLEEYNKTLSPTGIHPDVIAENNKELMDAGAIKGGDR